MSGNNPPPQGAGDPSMEDILASIRRILSEDDQPPAGSKRPGQGEHDVAAPHPPSPEGDEKDVLVLDPSMMVSPPAESPTEEHPMSEPATPLRPNEPLGAGSPGEPGDGLVAPEAAAATASSVQSLVRTLTERGAQVHQNGPTLEDLVREEIRPVLKQWLDTHLPPIVERLVRIEIERVVGRAVP